MVKILVTGFQFLSKTSNLGISFTIQENERPQLCFEVRPRDQETIKGFIQTPTGGESKEVSFNFCENEKKEKTFILLEGDGSTSFITTNPFVEE
jgi:hypothetical protein